jgi:hypothetical protein
LPRDLPLKRATARTVELMNLFVGSVAISW